MKTIAELCFDVVDLFYRYGWCKENAAQDSLRLPVSWKHPGAARFCAIGAMEKVLHSNGIKELDEKDRFFNYIARCLQPSAGYDEYDDVIAAFNDEACETKTDVIDFFLNAGRRYEKEHMCRNS